MTQVPEQQLCSQLSGVGPSIAARLAKCGIHTIQDLLFHLPYRYQDRTRVTALQDCQAGDFAVLEGVIVASQVRLHRRRVWVCRLQDLSGSIELQFFHFNTQQRQLLGVGKRVRCYGEVRYYQQRLSMIHPEYQVIPESGLAPVETKLTPLYPLTEGLSQYKLRQLSAQALALNETAGVCEELLPEAIRQRFSLADISQALQFIHHPPPEAQLDALCAGEHPMQQRLAFEELLANQLALKRIRASYRTKVAPSIPLAPDLEAKFMAALPFVLTAAQQRTSLQIKQDLQACVPMLRLIQGDVGSGKTVVAAISALQAIASKYQVALMAPTEILAEQHFHNFNQWLEPLGMTVMFLSGKSSGRNRRELLAFLEMGEIDCLIGTHALFQEDVKFQQLGLVIIDEQHRFGVHQRLALGSKGDCQSPHQLILTATPIPRTLAMTAYANLDLSVIDELPPGRLPIPTAVIPNHKRDEVIARVQAVIAAGQQAFWVCTLIDESEVLQAQAAAESVEYLQQALPELSIGLIHGRLSSVKKQQMMQQFKQGKIEILVATTVIEVGVDVPNASLMVIENAERLGLAQLHQLRGRVGRGAAASYCVLLYQSPLSETAKARLAIMRETNDGFKIASRDLELRGPGEVLGTKQTGVSRLRIADIIRDQSLLPAVKQAATMLFEQYPDLVPALIRRWLGDNEKYSRV
jgi:ATP-dependent DNA helicase RecG